MASSPMSVHDPMGNSHNRGRTKKKQVIEKEGASTFNSRDENDGVEEIDDGGLRDFQESKLKRQEEKKNLTDMMKPKLDVRKEGYVEEERSNQTVHGTSNSMPSSDQCQSMLNTVVEARHRNLHKNHASTQDTVSGDDERDLRSTFDNGHEQQSGLNRANGTCDVADGADHSIYDLELRESYTPNSLGQGTGSFPSCQDKPDTNPSTNTNCGNEGAESIRKNPAQWRNLRSTSDDGHEQQSGLNQANGTCDVADGADHSIYNLELRESYTPNSLGQGTGSFPSCQDKPDTNPSTNTDCGNEGAESIRKTPAQQKTPEEQNDYSHTSSVPPMPQSKIESRTPETTQIVPGANPKGLGEDGKEKKVFEKKEEGNAAVQESTGHEHLKMLEVIKEDSELLEKLSKYLDHEMRVIRCWKHLAHVLGVPSDETREFEMYSEYSPTEDLFVYLTEVWRPELEVKELKQKLQKIHRNDLIESLNTGLFKDNMKVGHLISGETKFIKLLSPKLDVNSRTIGNWRSLASEFGITKQVAEKFGLRGSGPSAALFRYIGSTEKLCDLTMSELQDHFEGMGRKDLVNLLKKEFENKSIEGSMFVRDVVIDESPLLTEIGDRLNKDIRAIKNWRNLAYRLKIPPETYKAFDSSKAEAKSPTKMMFAWLARWKPNLSVGDLLEGIKKIDRYDVVELVTKEAEIVFQKKEHGNAAAQQSTAKQLSDLVQMHLENDKERCLISNLAKKAAIEGFIIQDNDGGGNCMFHALSRQLEIKLGFPISHGDLRNEIVEYLKNNRKLPKVGDLFSFIYDKKSWREFLDDMAEDGTWGNHVVLVAAANRFGTPICVISSMTDHDDILITPSSASSQDTEPLVLGHVFEYHYVSLEPKSMSVQGGNFQSLIENRPLSTKSKYGQLPFSSTYQQHQQCYQQGLALNQAKEIRRSLGLFQSQRNYLSNGKTGNLPEEERIAIRVRQLPFQVYRKVCEKLSVKRSMTFDDFRMVADKLGVDRDTMEFLGQQSNPADVMFSQFGRNLQVDKLIGILHEMERFDIAAVLEDWVVTGNLSEKERIAIRVRQLPFQVYRKVCEKLSVKRSMTFDDFRMVADKLGVDRDTMEFLGQQSNPADVMFSQFGRNLQVDKLIGILHEMERFDIAAVLEDWVVTGNLSEKERIAIRVRQLPFQVYRKVCEKLSVKRSMTFDDFRMVADKLGVDRDTMEFLGQQSNPADVMFSQFGRNLQVDKLIGILHEMERFDIAAVLEDWVVTGNLLTEEGRIAIKVRQLPVRVYRKVCEKLSVKRSMTFDDFRMVAEKLGLDGDTMEFLGQQSNPADVMFSQFGRNLQVDKLIGILHEMERFDIAAVLEDWVVTGNPNWS